MKEGSKARIDNPPEHWGPGSDGPVWCPRRKRYDLPLNAVGQQIVENYLTKYHNWPLAPLKARDGKLYRKVIDYFGEDEADAMARHCIVKAAARYQPEDYGCSQEGYTYLVQGLWMHFSRAAELVEESWDKPREMQALELEGEMIDFVNLPNREPPVEKCYERTEKAEAINLALRMLDRRSRQVVVAYYQTGLTAEVIGKRLHVHRNRILQILKAAREKMRAALTSQTLLDRIDPTRSEECPTDATVAASKPSSAGRKSIPPPSPTSQRERVAKWKRPKRSRSMT